VDGIYAQGRTKGIRWWDLVYEAERRECGAAAAVDRVVQSQSSDSAVERARCSRSPLASRSSATRPTASLVVPQGGLRLTRTSGSSPALRVHLTSSDRANATFPLEPYVQSPEMGLGPGSGLGLSADIKPGTLVVPAHPCLISDRFLRRMWLISNNVCGVS
jgi:hypothetical protein